MGTFRNTEKDKGRVDAEALLDGMLNRERLLDLVENFILFDDSRAGGTRKIVARNHQVLGVNNVVASVQRQEELKRLYPERLTERSVYRMIPERHTKVLPARKDEMELPLAAEVGHGKADSYQEGGVTLSLIERAHPDLGRLGVFWHTQGSGKSYSMAFFAEKVRRCIPGNFTFLVMTDREDLDDQIWRTFIGCGITDEKTPRAGSGKELQEILRGNPRFVFSLIHKFNQPVAEPYSERDDIIVVSDEAHRTQAGKFARNMRLAMPNAAFIGFTGTPLFKHDELTRRIFGDYISRYDFKRSEEDHSTVKLIYENRGEKLGLARLDLNDRIAEAVEKAELDPDQTALLEKLLGKDYEIITADDRLDKLAADFVEHCTTRWQTGKSMFVCIDKITCARMFQRIEPRWKAKLARLKALIPARETALAASTDPDDQERAVKKTLMMQQWLAKTETKDIERHFQVFSGAIKKVGEDFSWLAETLAAFAKVAGWDERFIRRIDNLSQRLVYGVPEKGLALSKIRIRGFGRAHINRLVHEGYDTAEIIADLPLSELVRFLPKRLAERLYNHFRKEYETPKETNPDDQAKVKEELGRSPIKAEAHEGSENNSVLPCLLSDIIGNESLLSTFRMRLYDVKNLNELILNSPLIFIDEGRQLLWYRGIPIQLWPASFCYLLLLAKRPKEMLKREEIYNHLWPGEMNYSGANKPYERQISDHKRKLIAQIRKGMTGKGEFGPQELETLIFTRPKLGYMLNVNKENVFILP